MTWVNLEDIKQNKLDKERQILYDRTYGRQLKGVKCVEAGSRIAVARSWGKEGMGKLSFSGFRVSVLEDEILLETDGGNGCTTK